MSSDQYPPLFAVRDIVARSLAEDLMPLGDLTASLLPEPVNARAEFRARAQGTIAGKLCVIETFTQVNPTVVVDWRIEDGEEVDENAAFATVSGDLASILTAERTALNLLCHLSGIATTTRRFVRAARGKALIRDTRKTTPGLRTLEKAAVRAGGGANHRGSLSDGILVKDNHLRGISITEAVRRAHFRWPGRVVEVECDNASQVDEAVAAKADMIMLDNMSPAEVAAIVARVGGAVPLEVSGGVSIQTVGAYADAGPAFISIGSITHSAPILDIGLDLQP